MTIQATIPTSLAAPLEAATTDMLQALAFGSTAEVAHALARLQAVVDKLDAALSQGTRKVVQP